MNDRFVYYVRERENAEEGQVPDEYKGHPVFEAKHMAGLLGYRP